MFKRALVVAVLSVAAATTGAQAQVVSDSFTGTDGTALENHVGEVAASWTRHPNYPASIRLESGRAWGPEWALHLASGIPPTNEYDVTADLTVRSNSGAVGVVARSGTTGTDSLYMGRYNAALAEWQLVRCTSQCDVLGRYPQTLTIGSSYAIRLEVRNASKKLFVDGVQRASSTDNTVTQIGWAGIRSGPGLATTTTGYHVDNFKVAVPSADSSIDAGPSGPTSNASPSFSFSSIPAGGTFSCMLDGPGTAAGTWAACTSPAPYSGLAQGSYTFNVRATVGGITDSTPATRSFTVDTTAPQTTIDSGPSGTIATNSASFVFSSETGATFDCKLDGPGTAVGTWGSCVSPKNYTALPNGSYTFSARARDAAGNLDATPATRAFTVAGGPPAYTTTFQDSFEGTTFPQVFALGAWCGDCGVAANGKHLDGAGAYFNQITPSGYAAADGTKVADSGLTSTSTRAEIQCHRYVTPYQCAGGDGTEWVYEWSFRVPSDVTIPDQPHAARPNIMQTKTAGHPCYGGGMVVWRSGDASKFELRQNIRGGTITDSNGGCALSVADTLYFLGTFSKNAWHRVTLHAKWSSNASVGFERIWIDGTEVMPKQSRPNLISGATSQMFRLGIYNSINNQPAGNSNNWHVLYDDVKIGTP